MKGTNKHCYMLNTQALSLVVLELEDFSHYKPTAHMDIPGAWSIWTPGTWLAGLMKGTTKHCYIQNIEALGLVIFFLCFSHCKSMRAICCHGNHNFDTICSKNLMQSIPLPSDGSHKILSRSARLIQKYLSRLAGKPTMWFPNRSGTNPLVQVQKRARSLKFLI